ADNEGNIFLYCQLNTNQKSSDFRAIQTIKLNKDFNIEYDNYYDLSKQKINQNQNYKCYFDNIYLDDNKNSYVVLYEHGTIVTGAKGNYIYNDVFCDYYVLKFNNKGKPEFAAIIPHYDKSRHSQSMVSTFYNNTVYLVHNAPTNHINLKESQKKSTADAGYNNRSLVIS